MARRAGAGQRGDWQAARRALPQTGRWPIAVSVWGGPEDDELLSRVDMDVPDLDVSPLAILSRLGALDVDRMLDDYEAGDGAYLPDDEHLAHMLGETVKRVGSAPSLAALHAALARRRSAGRWSGGCSSGRSTRGRRR